MESHNLIKKRNFILLLIFWLLYFVHIVLYHFIAADPHLIVFISGGILLLVVTAMYYFRFHPTIIMYSFFICDLRKIRYCLFYFVYADHNDYFVVLCSFL